jgi:acyl-coenzyme A thioesterase PaaI-like protein
MSVSEAGEPVRSVGAAPLPAIDGRSELADGIRELLHLLVGRPLPTEALDVAATEIRGVAERLSAAAGDGPPVRDVPIIGDRPSSYFSTSLVFGEANPLAPPAQIWAVTGPGGEREVRGSVTFGAAYEGPPTCVHGGALAQLFDELLGAANVLIGRAAMTGTLTISYRRPTPLLVPLDLESRHVAAHGRRIIAEAAVRHAGAVTAEARGVFVEVRRDRLREVVAANLADAPAGELARRLAALREQAGEASDDGGVGGP